MNEMTVIVADVVFPVVRPPVDKGAVVVGAGVVQEVGTAAAMRAKYPGAEVVELRGQMLLPGLVNAHCHLELGYLRGRLPAGHFVDWVKGLLRENMALENRAEVVAEAVRSGVKESLRGGVTGVGDTTKQIAESRAVLRQGPIRAVSFGEISGIGARRSNVGASLAAARDGAAQSATMRVGLSPHAPYTVEGPALQQIAGVAAADGLLMSMHVAELAEEAEFLETLGGRLREAWDIGGTAHEILDARIPRFAGGPIRWAEKYGLLAAGRPALLAHVNYVVDDEFEILQRAMASVAYCPRTRAFFGHDAVGPHRFEEMLARGINVCLATDSLASNPDLQLMREAQFVLKQRPGLSATTLLEMVTVRGARALGGLAGTGTIAAGGPADLAAFAVPTGSGGLDMEAVLRSLLLAAPEASAVWVGGEKAL